MFIRFVSGEIDSDSHVETGLFYAAYKLKYEYDLPEYELDWLQELLDWFNNNLNSPLEFRLRKGWRSHRAICWFKSSAFEYVAKARDMAVLLENNGIYIRTIRSAKIGYMLYEDDAQVFAQPFTDMKL
jgi:hypothetical protein